MIFDSSGHAEGAFTKSQNGRQGRAALRLESEENAGRFEDGSLSLPVASQKKIKARRKLDTKRFKAAKISELKFGEHGQQNDECRMTNDKKTCRYRHSGFVIPSSFVIRASSFFTSSGAAACSSSAPRRAQGDSTRSEEHTSELRHIP